VFIAYSVLQKPGSTCGPNEIVVANGEVEHLTAGFAKTWQCLQTPQQMAGLVKNRVLEEVYYREAMRLKKGEKRGHYHCCPTYASFRHVLSRTKSARSRFEQPTAGPQDEIHGCIS
jgi:hypothetical protein